MYGRYSLRIPLEIQHFAVLNDVHAKAVRGARESPGHGVVARSAGPALDESSEDGQARLRRNIERRYELRNLVPTQQLAIHSVQLHGVRHTLDHFQVVSALRQVNEAARTEHDVEIQLAPQGLVEADREVIQPG